MRAYTMSVPAAFVLVMNACASIHPIESAQLPVNGKVITEAMIAASNAATAWDVVQQTGYYRMISDPISGRSGVHSRRGRTSMLLAASDVPRLIVDGARITLHMTSVAGRNGHHVIEASFKGVARALRDAVRLEGVGVPSTKGVL